MLKFQASRVFEKSIASIKHHDFSLILLTFRASGVLETLIKSIGNLDFSQFCLNFEPRESWKKQSNPSKNHNFPNFAYISSLWSPWKINQILWKSRCSPILHKFRASCRSHGKINQIHWKSLFFEFCLNFESLEPLKNQSNPVKITIFPYLA